MNNTLMEIEGGHCWYAWTSVEDVHSSLQTTSRIQHGISRLTKPPPKPEIPPEVLNWRASNKKYKKTSAVHESAENRDIAVKNELRHLESGYYTNETLEYYYGSSQNEISSSLSSSSGSRDDLTSSASSVVSSSNNVNDDMDKISFGQSRRTPSIVGNTISCNSKAIVDDDAAASKSQSPTDDERASTIKAPIVQLKRPKMRNALFMSLASKEKAANDSSDSYIETSSSSVPAEMKLKPPSEFLLPATSSAIVESARNWNEDQEDCAAYDYKKDDTIDDETKRLIKLLEEGASLSSSRTNVIEKGTKSNRKSRFNSVVSNSVLSPLANSFVPIKQMTEFHISETDFPPL